MKQTRWAAHAMAMAFSMSLAMPLAMAQSCSETAAGFKGFIAEMKKEAAAEGVSKRSIAVLDTVAYDPAIIKRDRAQNIFSDSFLAFQAKMISKYRLSQGQALLQKHKTLFDKINKQYGVPAPVIVAFWALETDFGATTGDFDTVQAIATLAWDCRRPEKFRPQLLAALKLMDGGDLSRAEFKGAWAGEIGQTQFMAYDYNESAVDYDGDGKRDLRNSVPDVLASTANLLRKHGWQPNQPWLQEVTVPTKLPWDQADIAISLPRSQWAKWGVTKTDGSDLKADAFPAALLLPMGRNGPAFLAYENFTTAYLKWNESLVYSTTAAYLATRIAGAPAVKNGRAPVKHPTYEQIVQLQNRLAALGYDVGKIDGKIGKGTRAAVKDQQVKLGLPADSYPDPEVIARIVKGGKKTTAMPMQEAPPEVVEEAEAPAAAPAKMAPEKSAKKKPAMVAEPSPDVPADGESGDGDSLY
jgi:lytic murein transglycosylase